MWLLSRHGSQESRRSRRLNFVSARNSARTRSLWAVVQCPRAVGCRSHRKGGSPDVGRRSGAVSGKRADSSQAQEKAHSTRWRHGTLGSRRRTRRRPLQWERRCFRQLRWRGSGKCRVKWRRGWWVGSMKSREQQERSPRSGASCFEGLSNNGVHPTPCARIILGEPTAEGWRARRG